MKIRIRYLVLIVVAFLIIGYIIGAVWPMKMFQFEVSDTPITKGDHRANLINLFVAVGTILTVIVALFKDEIWRRINKVDLKLSLLSDTIKDDYDTEKNVVTRYYNNIEIKNIGRSNALQCEISIKSIQFLKTGDPKWQEIDIENPQLSFLYNSDASYISVGATRKIQICEISIPSDSTERNKENITFKLGDNIIDKKQYNGQWVIKGEISMSNDTVKYFTVKIDWNGEWYENHERMQITSKIEDK